ncbi:MAG: N-acetyl-gamma-glutamyl-phosphate reductase [Oscillospiraceae bacterium]|jgi:N-acetyl-gamma-glutamyl-phosphate reductase|nr:N-acetyl-gamma-glutamyl-phosphate reductase [Oscillospiraceae bacterium]
MPEHRVFIDGAEGTTGLQIHGRLAARGDIELLRIPEALRKSAGARRELINAADLVILALPDDAAREAVTLVANADTKVIDASTAHRVSDGWVYGLPELPGQREKIRTSKRVANPGCHATGAVMLLRPLRGAGLIPDGYPVAITSVTGYTGGGKKMIAEYETADRGVRWELNAPRSYALGQGHKHIPEIVRYASLGATPSFVPVVADYPEGMQVIVPLAVPGLREAASEVFRKAYGACRNVRIEDGTDAFESSNVNADTDRITLRVAGNDEIAVLIAQLGNLGKGASGAAVQNMNIMLGFNEFEGLIL